MNLCSWEIITCSPLYLYCLFLGLKLKNTMNWEVSPHLNFLEEFEQNWYYFFLKWLVLIEYPTKAIRAWGLFCGEVFNCKLIFFEWCKALQVIFYPYVSFGNLCLSRNVSIPPMLWDAESFSALTTGDTGLYQFQDCSTCFFWWFFQRPQAPSWHWHTAQDLTRTCRLPGPSIMLSPSLLWYSLPVNFSHFTSLNLPLSLSVQGNHLALRGPLSLETCSR